MAVLPDLIGTGDWASEDYPTHWIETLFRLRPNAKATMAMFYGMKKAKPLPAPKWNWPEKDIRNMVLTSDFAAVGATTIVFQGTTPLKGVRAGDVLRSTLTDEVIWCSADPASPYTDLVCIRGGSTGSTAVENAADTKWLLVSNRNAEGGPLPTAIFRTPSWKWGCTQIFKRTSEVTGTASVTELRWAKQGPTDEMLMDALEDLTIDIESQGIWGVAYEGTGTNGKPERTTGGVLYYVTTNVLDFGGVFSLDDLLDGLRLAFRKGSDRKLGCTGDMGLLTWFKMVLSSTVFNIDANVKAWGANVTLIRTPWGELMLKKHELLTESEVYADSMLILDTKNSDLRYLRDRNIKLTKDAIKDGYDRYAHQYLGELGWEYRLEETHSVWHNFSGYTS